MKIYLIAFVSDYAQRGVVGIAKEKIKPCGKINQTRCIIFFRAKFCRKKNLKFHGAFVHRNRILTNVSLYNSLFTFVFKKIDGSMDRNKTQVFAVDSFI